MQATSSDDEMASVYASVDADDPAHVVIIAINKANQPRSAGIAITHTVEFTAADVYTVTASGGANVVPAADITPVATNAWNYTMPAHSISIIVPG